MSAPEPMVPNQPAKLQFSLGDKYHTFLKGHRIMVQVQSSWFPMFDRNPQTFVDIYHAKPADYQKAEHTVFRSASRADVRHAAGGCAVARLVGAGPMRAEGAPSGAPWGGAEAAARWRP